MSQGPGHLFYAADSTPASGQAPVPPGGYRTVLWRPSALEWRPRGVPGTTPSWIWSTLHHTRTFPNRDYSILLLYHGERPVHRSFVFPRYLRFPFMAPNDLQIGDTWTDPAHRGRGLATFALREVSWKLGLAGRRFWYLVAPDNLPSIRAAVGAGFRLVGSGERIARYGLWVLGAFVMDPPTDPTPSPEDT